MFAGALLRHLAVHCFLTRMFEFFFPYCTYLYLVVYFLMLPERSGVEQHFSKADRCFHEGRFGPKAADTERRCTMVLGVTNMDDERKIIAGARLLYATAVKTYKGKQKHCRMDKGVAKAKKASSERTWLQNKKQSLQKAMVALPRTPSREDLPESAQQTKEIALQRKRRLDRAIEAADNGYLLQEDEGPAPFAASASKRIKSLRQDEQRIEKMALNKMCWNNTSRPQLWNWKPLGAVKAWSAPGVSIQAVAPLVPSPVAWPFLILLLFWWCLGVLGVWGVGSIIEDELGWLLPKMADG